jgi:uncharacterized protein (DUF1501 family)
MKIPTFGDIVTWQQDPAHFRTPRRSFLRVGVLGGLGLTLGDLLRTTARADLKHYDSKEGKAKSIIHITLGGGMAAQESWDPKPEAPLEYRGPLGVAKTCLPGVAFSENLSHTARVADKMTVIRSMTGREADHGRATYTMFTGYRMSPALKHPAAGAIISHEFGSRHGLPAYIGVPNVHPDAGTGYLSAKYAGFGIGGDPGKGDFKVRDLTLMPHVDESRFTRRRDLRLAVEDHFRSLDTKSDALGAMDEFYQQAYTLISSASARDAFDLSKEPAKLAETYGKNEAGGRLLLARRLVESGVRMVNVSYGGWDHHAGIADNIRKQLPPLDQALAALITDLDQRGLLDSTIVMVTSEFGRTPKINATAGRDHFARVFSCMVAGGGFTRGQIFGATDATATEPESNPVAVEDLMTTVYHQMGINADKELMAPGGRPMEIVDGGRIVKEILT